MYVYEFRYMRKRQTLQAEILLTQNYHNETEVIILHLSPAINQPKEPKQGSRILGLFDR